MIRTLDGITPRIHPTAFVSEAAYVIGDVEIGEGSSVWPGSVIRGDMGKITIGKYTCVQDNSVVHCDTDATIGDYVVIGHRVVCHAKNVGAQNATGQRRGRQRRRGDRRRVRRRVRRGRVGRYAGARPLDSRGRAGTRARAGAGQAPGTGRILQQSLCTQDAALQEERWTGVEPGSFTSCPVRSFP